jgi:hypothetical protein
LVAGTYTVTVTDANGCTATCASTVGEPAACPPPYKICPGNILTITAVPNRTNYKWYKDGTLIAGAIAQTYDATVAGTYTYTADSLTCTGTICCPVVVQDSTGCCVQPTVGTPVATQATCTAGVANSDASIAVSGIANGTTYSYSTDGTTFNTSTAFTGATFTINSLPNPATATTYTIRVFNGAATCFRDVTVVLQPKVCTTPCGAPNCLPVTLVRH